jgi:predicted nuclease of predicted toxin-antitoxin system
MNFKVDENLPIEVARQFQMAGHDASTVIEEGLGGESDSKIIDRCQRESRALITLDIGFGDIRAYPPGENSGVIVLRLQRQDKGYLLAIVGRLIKMLEVEQVDRRLWIVDEERIRVRG